MKVKNYYGMNEEQYEEMKLFYEKLGFEKKQVKKLCKKCFGADIRKTSKERYRPDWTFYRKKEFLPPVGRMVADEDGAMPPALMGGAMMGMNAMASCRMSGFMGAAPACMMPMMEPPEFNTAETHDVPENEQHSPLDEAQLIFSANVNTASWDHLRSRIMRNEPIDRSFVRIEEIINSYRYDLKKPSKEDLFSVEAENGKCPWDEASELLFLGFKGRKAKKSCRQNLALLVDVSGSMEDNWILTQMSIAAIVSKLKKGDTLSIIAYSDKTTTVAKKLDGGDMDKCVDAIMDIDGVGGCTNGSEGLNNAYQYLADNYDQDGNNRVFIFTDGDFNFGITAEGGLKGFIEEKRKTGIYLSIVGYGENNFKDNKMETLARNGNGNYTFISNPYDILDNLWEKLVSNLVTVAKNVKISVELNPAYVSEYRLIGYDDRMLTQQEFHDTEKAVDGIGSQHNVVALIQLKRGKAEKQFTNRYVKVDAVEQTDEFAFVEVHYQSPEGENLVMTRTITVKELEGSESNNLTVAGMLAGFGMLVKDSDYKGKMDKALLQELLKKAEKAEEVDTPVPYSHFDVAGKYVKS